MKVIVCFVFRLCVPTTVAWMFVQAPSGPRAAVYGAESNGVRQAGGGAVEESHLSGDEIETMAGTPADGMTGRKGDVFGKRIQEALHREPVSQSGVRARRVNVKYGDHPRNVFDFWQVDAAAATPLVVFIHGGGFRRGDKSLLYDSTVLVRLLDPGISVAGVNYRFSHQSDDGILGSLNDVKRFIQFIRFHAAEYNVDKDRIGCYGGSAGGTASLWLAFRDDMTDPDSPDPIGRESTRLTCAGAMATPATLDVLKWKELLGITHQKAVAAAKFFGLKEEVELYAARGLRHRAQMDLVELMSPDDSPVFIHNNERGGVPSQVGHMGHHPNHARFLKQRADQVGIEAVVFAPQIGLVDPSGEDLVSFFQRHLVDP